MQGYVGVQGKIMRSTLTDQYKANLRQRFEDVKPKRHTQWMDEDVAKAQGRNLRAIQTGGMQSSVSFATAVRALPNTLQCRAAMEAVLGPPWRQRLLSGLHPFTVLTYLTF